MWRRRARLRSGPRRRGPHPSRDVGRRGIRQRGADARDSPAKSGASRGSIRGSRTSATPCAVSANRRRSRSAVIGAIGLGIGLNTTIFTIFNAYVLRPHAVRDPIASITSNGAAHDFTAVASAANCRCADSTRAIRQYRSAARRRPTHSGQAVTGNYFDDARRGHGRRPSALARRSRRRDRPKL